MLVTSTAGFVESIHTGGAVSGLIQPIVTVCLKCGVQQEGGGWLGGAAPIQVHAPLWKRGERLWGSKLKE